MSAPSAISKFQMHSTNVGSSALNCSSYLRSRALVVAHGRAPQACVQSALLHVEVDDLAHLDLELLHRVERVIRARRECGVRVPAPQHSAL
jgi:hypothetical protein